MRTKKLVAGLAATAALALPFVFAAPAVAATLPAGDSLYAISCDEDSDSGDAFALLYSVNPADAVGTVIGSGSGIEDDCAEEAAFNPVTGDSYYISNPSVGSRLAKIDVTTGATTFTTWTGDYPGPKPDGIAIGKDGTAYVIIDSHLYLLTLATAELTDLGDLGGGSLKAFSVDPTSGLFYAVDQVGGAYRIDPAAVTATFIANVVTTDPATFSLQIDTSGVWWVEADNPGDPYLADIWTGVRPADGLDSVFTLVGPLNDITNEFFPYSQALLITYPKALAATGVDATVLIGAGVTAGLLMLMGAAVLVLRRRAV